MLRRRIQASQFCFQRDVFHEHRAQRAPHVAIGTRQDFINGRLEKGPVSWRNNSEIRLGFRLRALQASSRLRYRHPVAMVENTTRMNMIRAVI